MNIPILEHQERLDEIDLLHLYQTVSGETKLKLLENYLFVAQTTNFNNRYHFITFYKSSLFRVLKDNASGVSV